MSHFCCSCLTFLIENISLKWSCHHHYEALQNVGLYICSASIAFEQRGILIVPHLYCNMQSLGLLSWPELKVFWSSVVRILVFFYSNTTWHKAFLGKGDSGLFNEGPRSFKKRNSENTLATKNLLIQNYCANFKYYFLYWNVCCFVCVFVPPPFRKNSGSVHGDCI